MSDTKTFGSLGIGEYRPGVQGRRYEPEGGMKNLRAKIGKDIKHDRHRKDLPFSFGKPAKSKGHSILVKCNNCGELSTANNNTVGKICSKCNKFSTVTEVCVEE